MRKYRKQCDICGADVERSKNYARAVCFNCRMEKVRKTANDHNKMSIISKNKIKK